VQSCLEWREAGPDLLVLDVLDYRIRIRTSTQHEYYWSLSTGERGRSPTLHEAKETSTYHLRLTLEELDDSVALAVLNHLDDESDADRATYTRGLGRKNQF